MMQDRAPFRLRWPHYLLAVLVYLALLLAWAPASLLAWALPHYTGQAVWLDRAAGSVWRGQAAGVRVQSASAPDLQLGRLNWQLRPLDLFAGRLGFQLQLGGAGIDAAGVLRAGTRGSELRELRAELPAKMLGQVSPDLALWQPGGRLLFESAALAFKGERVDGQANLRWLDAASGRVRPPLGNYRFDLAGAESGFNLKLTTESGALQLQGSGVWNPQRGMKFNGMARPAPESRLELDGLLSLIGPSLPDGSRAIRISN
jgi:general secretion pathway protein N